MNESDNFTVRNGQMTFTDVQVNCYKYENGLRQVDQEASNTGHEIAADILDIQHKNQGSVKKKKKGKPKDVHRRIAQRMMKCLSTNTAFLKKHKIDEYFLNRKEISKIKKENMSKDECRENYNQRIDPTTVSRHQVMKYLYSNPELRIYLRQTFKDGKMKRQIQIAERAKKTVDDNKSSNSTTKIQIYCNNLHYLKEFVTAPEYYQIQEVRDEDGQNIEDQNRDEDNQYLQENSIFATALNQQRNQEQSQQIFQKSRESQQSQELLLPASLKGAIRKKERDSN